MMVNKHTMVEPCSRDVLFNMYIERDMSTIEIASELGCSSGKINAWLRKFGIPLRGRKPRSKRGEDNHKWKGDEASYDAFHKRVVSVRGKPQLCEECGDTEGNMVWANLNGNYSDVNDYARLCRSCHQRIDCERRVENKCMTSTRNNLNGGFRHSNRCILNEEQAVEAKRLKENGWTYAQLGKRYGVTPQAIFRIVKGKSWKHLS